MLDFRVGEEMLSQALSRACEKGSKFWARGFRHPLCLPVARMNEAAGW
jgi:hypothetical protein